jgi:nucleoside 2-deoxyribosyltransferase
MLVYLASPYSHPDPAVKHERFLAACRAAGSLIQQGVHVFSPIAHTHPIALACDLPGGWEFWAEYDRLMIAACDELHVLMLDGWRQSAGVQAEMLIAETLGKPIRWITVGRN